MSRGCEAVIITALGIVLGGYVALGLSPLVTTLWEYLT